MHVSFNNLVNRLDQLIEEAESLLAEKTIDKELSRKKSWLGGQERTVYEVDRLRFETFRASALYFMERTLGTENSIYSEFQKRCNIASPYYTELALGLLKALRAELETSWLWSTRGMATAEVLSDFVEMAEHLLSKGYKDAAAVIGGSALEEHLRRLCERKGIPVKMVKGTRSTPKKADLMNSELASAEVYLVTDQKNVTHLLDIRNKAAHGNYGDYTEEQVSMMLQQIRDFLARNAA